MFTITEYYNSVMLSATELRTNNDRNQPGEDTDVYLFAELKRIDAKRRSVERHCNSSTSVV